MRSHGISEERKEEERRARKGNEEQLLFNFLDIKHNSFVMKKTDLSESLIEEKKKDSEDEENASGSKHTTLKVKLSQVLSEEERTETTLEKKYTINRVLGYYFGKIEKMG